MEGIINEDIAKDKLYKKQLQEAESLRPAKDQLKSGLDIGDPGDGSLGSKFSLEQNYIKDIARET